MCAHGLTRHSAYTTSQRHDHQPLATCSVRLCNRTKNHTLTARVPFLAGASWVMVYLLPACAGAITPLLVWWVAMWQGRGKAPTAAADAKADPLLPRQTEPPPAVTPNGSPQRSRASRAQAAPILPRQKEPRFDMAFVSPSSNPLRPSVSPAPGSRTPAERSIGSPPPPGASTTAQLPFRSPPPGARTTAELPTGSPRTPAALTALDHPFSPRAEPSLQAASRGASGDGI